MTYVIIIVATLGLNQAVQDTSDPVDADEALRQLMTTSSQEQAPALPRGAAPGLDNVLA